MNKTKLSTIKAIGRQILPPILWSLISHLIRSKGKVQNEQNIFENERVVQLQNIFLQLNRDILDGEIVLREGIKLKISPSSRYPFEFFCFRSPDMVDELNMFIKLTEDKSRLLDVGALHGLFSLVFTNNSPSSSAIAVDASPIAFSNLLYNIYNNSLIDKITPLECALSSKDSGSLNMHYLWEHLVSAGTENEESNQSYVSVTMRTGDSLCEEHLFYPDTIKIDVEGHEVKVLHGLQSIISKHLPLIFLEVHPYQIVQEGNSISEIVDFFYELNYSAYCIDIRDNISLDRFCGFQDVFRLVLHPPNIAN